jgi:hypothetical protein
MMMHGLTAQCREGQWRDEILGSGGHQNANFRFLSAQKANKKRKLIGGNASCNPYQNVLTREGAHALGVSSASG